MSSGARRDATITTSAASIVAFLALLIPQVAGDLNLTTVGKVIVAVGVGLVTACAQRLVTCWRARQAIVGAVRVWPPERLGGARLLTLGVYPTKEDQEGRFPEYAPRPQAEEAALANALGSQRHVIVHGPAGCGKSRAISHAAGQELSEVPAVIPQDSTSLQALLDRGVDLPLNQPGQCLWLDGLDRFTEVIDPSTLDTIQQAKKPGARIIATIRSDQWNDLVAGTGHDSQAARALSEEAEIVELGEFTPPPTQMVQASSARPVKPRPFLADPPFMLLVVAAFAVVVFAGIFSARRDVFTPPSIDAQINTTTNQILAESSGIGRVILSERAQLHSTDQPSWLVVVRDPAPKSGAGKGAAPDPQSDDLRIYDVVDGRLRLELHYRPQGSGPTAADWTSLTAGAQPSADYARDGTEEVIAGYYLPDQATSALLPFAIEWQGGGYQLVSLTPDKPQLGTQGLDPAAIRFRREAYLTPITLPNAVTEPRFRSPQLEGYRVQAFALTQTPAPRLLTGYFAAYPLYKQTHVLEIHANQIRSGISIAPCQPDYVFCPAPRAAQDILVPPDRSADNGLLQGWDMDDSKWTTPVRLCPVRSPASDARLCPGMHRDSR